MNDPLKKYRQQYRFWKNHRKLQSEKKNYIRKFQQRALSIPNSETIQAALRQKFPNIFSKQKGHLNIIAVYHHYNRENYSLKPALEKFGAVRHYDWFGEFNHQSKDWHKKIKPKMNRALVEQIDIWMKQARADVIFTYLSGELVEPDTIQTIHKHGMPLVNLALNDKEHFIGKVKSGRAGGSRDICRYFDLCWTSTQDALIKYYVEGALPVYLPEGANPDIHKPYNIEKTIDVSFVGQCYGNRAAVIDELRKRDIKVEAYGYGWQNGALSINDMVQLYSRSKINLGFAGVSGHKDTFCLKGRDFEIPMSGGLYLTEDHTELTYAFVPGEEILTYSGMDDLVSKIKYYLAHPAEAQKIRTKGYECSLREHTWEGRFAKIFRLIGILE